MRTKKFIIVLVMLAASSSVMAQGNFKVKLGGAFPTGNFADAMVSNDYVNRWGLLTNDKYGGAGTGFNVGFQYTIPIRSVKGLGIAISADLFYNGLNEDLNDFFSDMEDDILNESGITDVQITKPSYLNIPLMVGGSYTFSVSENVGLFAELALGVNLMKVTDLYERVEYNEGGYSGEESVRVKYDMSTSFGYRMAAGVVFNNRYSIEIGYYNLGAGKIKGTNKEDEYEGGDHYNKREDFRYKSITPTMIAIRFGYAF